MATRITVILEAKAKDNGFGKKLEKFAKGADAVADAIGRVIKESGGIEGIRLPEAPVGVGGRGRGAGAGTGAAKARAKKAELSDFQRASAARERSQRDAVAARIDTQLNKERHIELELERERVRRMRRRMRREAHQKLGPDVGEERAGRKKRRGAARIQFAANLAVAGQEFEQFGAQVEGGIRSSFDAFKDYEKAVAEVATLTDKIPIDEIQSITTAAAEEFGGLPTDQVKAFYSIVSAGATTSAEAQEQLTAANKLAIGGVAEQEEAVLAISKSVANFGASGVDATAASDSLFTAVKRGQTTVAEMARALPQVAQAASGAGLSLDETNAAIAVLSTRFASAKEGATGLRQALSNIAKPTKGAREEAERLGVDFSTAGIAAAGGIQKFLVKLRDAEGFDENTLAKLFDSTEARASVSGLISGMDDYVSVLEDMENKQGAADTAFQKMSETSAQKAAKLEAQWEVLKITAGEALIPALTELSEAVGPILKDMTQWIKDNPELAAQLAKVAIGTAVASKGVGALSSGVSMITSLFGLGSSGAELMSSAVTSIGPAVARVGPVLVSGFAKVAAVLGPLGLAIAAIGVVAGGIILSIRDDMAELDAELERLDELNKATAEGGLGVSFQTEEGADKTEVDVLREQRERLAADLREKQNLFDDAQFIDPAKSIKENLLRQAESELKNFDKRFGSQVGVDFSERTDIKAFDSGGFAEGGIAQMVELLKEQAAATQAQTLAIKGQGTQGPSMEAGLT